MNKKELIATIRIKMLLASSSPERKGYIAGLEEAINIIEGFSNEPQKPVVPQFVADWIEYCKYHNFTLFGCFDPVKDFERLTGETFEGDARKCIGWCRRASDKIARAWLDGYEVKEEKRYTVKIKTYLGQFLGRYYLNDEELTPQFTRSQLTGKGELPTFTRQELEETGFGWVFDCEGIEVEEVD